MTLKEFWRLICERDPMRLLKHREEMDHDASRGARVAAVAATIRTEWKRPSPLSDMKINKALRHCPQCGHLVDGVVCPDCGVNTLRVIWWEGEGELEDDVPTAAELAALRRHDAALRASWQAYVLKRQEEGRSPRIRQAAWKGEEGWQEYRKKLEEPVCSDQTPVIRPSLLERILDLILGRKK